MRPVNFTIILESPGASVNSINHLGSINHVPYDVVGIITVTALNAKDCVFIVGNYMACFELWGLG